MVLNMSVVLLQVMLSGHFLNHMLLLGLLDKEARMLGVLLDLVRQLGGFEAGLVITAVDSDIILGGDLRAAGTGVSEVDGALARDDRLIDELGLNCLLGTSLGGGRAVEQPPASPSSSAEEASLLLLHR